MKIICFYLPQFHRILENDQWRGTGFTDWTSVKQAKPLFSGHIQPRLPMDQNFYDLTQVAVLKKQAEMAGEYGIYGFCMYHYWFCGKKLLQRPAELWLVHEEIDFPFCFSWANENWTKSWEVSDKHEILIEQTYGDEMEWKQHFEYLLPFFRDKRYIRVNGKPLFVIYRPEQIPNLRDRLAYWENLAWENGFSGIAFAAQQCDFRIDTEPGGECFTYQIEYQPAYLRKTLSTYGFLKSDVKCVDYKKACEELLQFFPVSKCSVPGAFVNWDNTPRKGKNGTVFLDPSPQIFGECLRKQLLRTKRVYHQDMLFLFAWNEWAEGGYLEPDEISCYEYLEAVASALKACDRELGSRSEMI